MARDNERGVERQDPVTGRDPVGDRTFPHDRRPFDEEDVAREDTTSVWHVDDHIAPRMRRTDLEELDRAIPDRERKTLLEDPRRQLRLAHLIEGKRSEGALHESPERRVLAPEPRHEAREHCSREKFHLLRRRTGCDDLRALDKRIAEAVIPVRVGVDELPDPPGRTGLGALHGVQHLAREPQVEERVDEQRFVAVDHEPGVTKAPGSIGLEIGVEPAADFLQPLLESKARQPELRETHA